MQIEKNPTFRDSCYRVLNQVKYNNVKGLALPPGFVKNRNFSPRSLLASFRTLRALHYNLIENIDPFLEIIRYDRIEQIINVDPRNATGNARFYFQGFLKLAKARSVFTEELARNIISRLPRAKMEDFINHGTEHADYESDSSDEEQENELEDIAKSSLWKAEEGGAKIAKDHKELNFKQIKALGLSAEKMKKIEEWRKWNRRNNQNLINCTFFKYKKRNLIKRRMSCPIDFRIRCDDPVPKLETDGFIIHRIVDLILHEPIKIRRLLHMAFRKEKIQKDILNEVLKSSFKQEEKMSVSRRTPTKSAHSDFSERSVKSSVHNYKSARTEYIRAGSSSPTSKSLTSSKSDESQMEHSKSSSSSSKNSKKPAPHIGRILSDYMKTGFNALSDELTIERQEARKMYLQASIILKELDFLVEAEREGIRKFPELVRKMQEQSLRQETGLTQKQRAARRIKNFFTHRNQRVRLTGVHAKRYILEMGLAKEGDLLAEVIEVDLSELFAPFYKSNRSQNIPSSPQSTKKAHEDTKKKPSPVSKNGRRAGILEKNLSPVSKKKNFTHKMFRSQKGSLPRSKSQPILVSRPKGRRGII